MKKEKLFYIGLVLISALSIYGLVALDNYEKEKANTRCGGADNVVVRYTNQGDKYYQCKVEK